jgi:hypothetical protein
MTLRTVKKIKFHSSAQYSKLAEEASSLHAWAEMKGCIPVHSKRAMRYRVRPWDSERHSRAGLNAHSGTHDQLPTRTLQTSEFTLGLLDTLQQ